jgi:putative tryptophan/tyrosine transport system substrate-binding protein
MRSSIPWRQMHFNNLRRREFITLLGGAAVAWPLAARAQQPAMPVIGFMSGRSPEDSVHLVAAFRQGLGEGGFVEGRNVAIEFRWARGEYDRLPALAAELVGRRVAVLAGVGGDPSARAAKQATATIPIVFGMGGDPIKAGLVESLNRPGGNATGYTLLTNQMEPKRLGLLHELAPGASLIGVLLNPSFPPATLQLQELEEAARTIGQRLFVAKASNDAELDAAFASLLQQGLGALLVAADPYFDTRRDRIIAFAAQSRLPAIYQFREYAVAGGLISYGPSITEGYRQAGIYAGRILKGAKPADLPVVQPTKFEFIINLKTAKALGFEIPPTVSARADEVIE